MEDSSHSSPLPAKRKRYTPLACDQCKRRKVKCDGQTPCHRCAQLPVECVYTERGTSVESRQESEWKKMNEKITQLQEQISLLMSNAASGVSSMQPLTLPSPVSTVLPGEPKDQSDWNQRELDRNSSVRQPPRRSRHPQYMGHTSSSYTFEVAKNSLEGVGIQAGTNSSSNHSSTQVRTPSTPNQIPYARDLLYKIPPNEAIQLIEKYEEESGTIYPFLDVKLVLRTAREFYSMNRGPSLLTDCNEENAFSGGILDIVKLTIAVALVIEAGGATALSTELLESVESGFRGRFCGLSVEILEIQVLTLMSILQFHLDEEVLAWRVIGFAGRAAVEMGLHRREIYFANFQDLEQRLWANKLFWCIYVLDRRWSFGTGLPFAIHDHDVDPKLPEPTDSDSSLLKLMITYGRIGSKVWKATANSDQLADAEHTAFLDFQVREWQISIPPELQLYTSGDDMLENHTRTRNRLRVLLYLRANQMRIHLFRRTLFTPKIITDDLSGAERVVNIAKDNIRVIYKLNQLSDIYSSQQTCFNYFLVSALGVLFLAVCHAAAHFNVSCREEFTMALDLVKGFSAKSYVAKKLWKSIKHLKVIGPKLGILPSQEKESDSERPIGDRDETTTHWPSDSESAVVPTEHNETLDYLPSIPLGATTSLAYNYSLNSSQLSNELTNLFQTIEPHYSQPPLEDHGEFAFFSQETTEDLSRSLRDLF